MLRQEDFQEFRASLGYVVIASQSFVLMPTCQVPIPTGSPEPPLGHGLLKAVLDNLVPTMSSGVWQHLYGLYWVLSRPFKRQTAVASSPDLGDNTEQKFIQCLEAKIQGHEP